MITALLASAFVPVWSEASYFTIWMQGSRIGYSSYTTTPASYKGSTAVKTSSITELKIGLIGSQVQMTIASETISVAGKPVQMHFVQSSAGRKQIMDAWFEPSSIRVEVNNNGAKTKQTLAYPKDGVIVDDPVAEFALTRDAISTAKTFYILDPSTVSLVKNSATFLGKKTVEINGVSSSENVVRIDDPRMNTEIAVSAKGDVLKIWTTIGMEMMPATKEEALGEIKDNQPDVAALMSIKPSKAISNPMKTSNLKIRLNADNLPVIPNDTQQGARKEGGAWLVNMKPTQLSSAKSVSIAAAAKAKSDWIKPSLHIPATSPQFKKLAKQIIKKSTDVRSASLAIRKYVNTTMTPNAGIGVLRDASEVLQAKEGVCRDYAILTATLCRAANIPARLASGLVNFDGNFYYHAWVEVWTGYDWLGLDSVPPTDFFSATHVKLGQGNVDQAFTFTILSNARMDVLEQKS